ncbi:hypothetical protein [Flavobacterium sp. J27]|uniref:hypothetical protein n=1 Tax=Flavobacterium sp. J27 TaxID=2060419 RepID=UPI0010323E57|nr:hypothetical protein [Flavobacterium sp. J27]
MTTIQLKYITNEEIQVLQTELHEYQNTLATHLKSQSDFLNAIIYIDLALRLWFNFRSKVENQQPKKGYSITLKASEAAVLLKACLWENQNNGTFERNVKTKLSLFLDQQLKSLSV